MRLVGTYVSPFARRVAAALVSRSIAYEHEDLNGYANPVRARELNPVGKVPILILDDGERLIDSAAIFDHLNELAGPRRALVPPEGRARRLVLRISAIGATLLEQTTAHYFEQQRPASCTQPELLERYRLQIIGGLKALDDASGPAGPIGLRPLDVATISAVVAVEYLAGWYAELDVARIAPKLAAVAAGLADDVAFARTRPATH
ncbi:MAG TPA: glutathione S-transferase N-terminal domain-containing protein [Dongiaceae bacterium]|jgi:glutathione S-transferase